MLHNETPAVDEIHGDANVIPASTHETPEDWYQWLDSIYANEQPLTEDELESLAQGREMPTLQPITTPVHKIDTSRLNPGN